MVDSENPGTRILLGGESSTAADVAASLEHGADAAGAASAFVDASDWEAWLSEITESLTADANPFTTANGTGRRDRAGASGDAGVLYRSLTYVRIDGRNEVQTRRLRRRRDVIDGDIIESLAVYAGITDEVERVKTDVWENDLDAMEALSEQISSRSSRASRRRNSNDSCSRSGLRQAKAVGGNATCQTAIFTALTPLADRIAEELEFDWKCANDTAVEDGVLTRVNSEATAPGHSFFCIAA